MALGAESTPGKDIWTLIDTRIQRWNMSTEGWEEVGLDHELGDVIRPALRNAFSSASEDDSALDLELLDLEIERFVLS